MLNIFTLVAMLLMLCWENFVTLVGISCFLVNLFYSKFMRAVFDALCVVGFKFYYLYTKIIDKGFETIVNNIIEYMGEALKHGIKLGIGIMFAKICTILYHVLVR